MGTSRALRLLPCLAIREAGDGQPDLLQRDPGHVRPQARPHPEADLQARPLVLQLAGNSPCACSLSVRTQAGLPGGGESAPAAQREVGGCSLLLVISSSLHFTLCMIFIQLFILTINLVLTSKFAFFEME